MTNPKYDSNNYLKHSPVIIHKNDSYQKLDDVFGSYLLLVKWRLIGVNKSPIGLSGTIKMLQSTPLGDFEPNYYSLKVSPTNRQYIQFLAITNPDFGYKLEVRNPENVIKTQIEIWEFIPPFGYPQSSPMPFYPEESTQQPIDLTPLIAATAANATAIQQLSTAVGAQPEAIAEAIAEDEVITLDPVVSTIGTIPVLILSKDDSCQGCLISNQGNTKIKLWAQDAILSPTTGYNSSGYIFEMPGKGSYEVVSPFFKTNIWAISNAANGQVSVTKTITAP